MPRAKRGCIQQDLPSAVGTGLREAEAPQEAATVICSFGLAHPRWCFSCSAEESGGRQKGWQAKARLDRHRDIGRGFACWSGFRCLASGRSFGGFVVLSHRHVGRRQEKDQRECGQCFHGQGKGDRGVSVIVHLSGATKGPKRRQQMVLLRCFFNPIGIPKRLATN